MIDYLVRPAITSKALLEVCQRNRFSLPDEFEQVNMLGDNDFTGFMFPIRVIETIGNNTFNNNFYLDMESELQQRWLDSIRQHAPIAESTATQLLSFYKIIALNMTNLNWSITEDGNEIRLVAKRGRGARHSIFEDLILYTFINAVLTQDEIQINTPFIIHAPYEKHIYEKYVSTSKISTFGSEHMIISVMKSKYELGHCLIGTMQPNRIDIYNKLVAAANTIPLSELSVSTLSFALGVSTRTLQRQLKPLGVSLKGVIKEVRFNQARRYFIKNQGNIKQTACDCGFTEQSRLTKLFTTCSGMTPSQYKSLKNRDW